MNEALGLSIGVANLVATRAGGVPVRRRSVLTLFDKRASDVGLPDENPEVNEGGLVIRGFVERVGDRSPMVAADGMRYVGEALTVEALAAMTRIVGHGTPVGVAFPAYWSDGQIAALRNEFAAQPSLAPNRMLPLLISDAKAAATALYAKSGVPTNGIVALCDFGAGGTSVTLATGGANFQQITNSIRQNSFSGNEIDHLIANDLKARARDARTSIVRSGAQTGSQDLSSRDCRRVKEQLSAATVATIGLGHGADIRLSRSDFEQLISPSLNRFIAWLEEALQGNRIPRSDLAAVAMVGGGASIPYLRARLSERLRVPVLTTPQPAFAAAIGAAMLARQQPPPAGAYPAPSPRLGTPPTVAATPPTRAATPPTVAVSPPAAAGSPLTETTPTESTGDSDGKRRSAPYSALAWSEETGSKKEPIPYVGDVHTDEHVEAQPEFHVEEEHDRPAEPGRLPWHKRTVLILIVAGAIIAVLAAVGLFLKLDLNKKDQTDTTTPSPTSPSVTTTSPSTSPSETPTTTTETTPATTEPPQTTTPYSPPATTTQPSRNPTTTPSQKSSHSQQPSSSPTSPNHHGPFPPTFPFSPPRPH